MLEFEASKKENAYISKREKKKNLYARIKKLKKKKNVEHLYFHRCGTTLHFE